MAETGRGGGRVWDEYDWDRCLVRRTSDVGRFEELLCECADHPRRDWFLARAMGWMPFIDEDELVALLNRGLSGEAGEGDEGDEGDEDDFDDDEDGSDDDEDEDFDDDFDDDDFDDDLDEEEDEEEDGEEIDFDADDDDLDEDDIDDDEDEDEELGEEADDGDEEIDEDDDARNLRQIGRACAAAHGILRRIAVAHMETAAAGGADPMIFSIAWVGANVVAATGGTSGGDIPRAIAFLKRALHMATHSLGEIERMDAAGLLDPCTRLQLAREVYRARDSLVSWIGRARSLWRALRG